MRTRNPQRRGEVLHVNHFQSLILARVQRTACCTSSPITHRQAAKLINSYGVIWTAITQLVLRNSGALLNGTACAKEPQCKPAEHTALTDTHSRLGNSAAPHHSKVTSMRAFCVLQFLTNADPTEGDTRHKKLINGCFIKQTTPPKVVRINLPF